VRNINDMENLLYTLPIHTLTLHSSTYPRRTTPPADRGCRVVPREVPPRPMPVSKEAGE
jgi:hypothetical protein